MTDSKSNGRGGPRVGAGRKRGIRKRLELGTSDAKNLYLLTKYRRALFGNPNLTEEQVIATLVEDEWKAVQQVLEPVEEMQEPFIV